MKEASKLHKSLILGRPYNTAVVAVHQTFTTLEQAVHQTLPEKKARGSERPRQVENACEVLNHADQCLSNAFSSGDMSRQIHKLQMQQQPRFPGAAESIQALSCLPQQG